uniref:RNA-dependent RNA polymerase n=1 Tax=Mesocestoides corti TaxID=53468 RepID=A0A5K3FV45_MESCO
MQANTHCKWPPNKLEDIMSVERGYDITLCVMRDLKLTKNRTSKLYPLKDLFHNVTSLTSVSYGDLAELPRSFWEKVKYPDVYHTYPQDVPMKQIVKDIKAGLPVSDMPEYNFPMRILKTSTKVCARDTHHDLVIVVKSGNLGWDARTAFRAYMQREKARYPKLKVGVVFSL